nr:integrase, catalytic region, zinc finger, CCHC-type, peptidase aspartic, catalytic [Tanacetum cinerariifolium]
MNGPKINQLTGVFVSQKAKSREELYYLNTSKTASASKSISTPNEEFSNDTSPSVARKFLNEEAANFVRDFKSLAKEADEIKRLLRADASQDIMSVVQSNYCNPLGSGISSFQQGELSSLAVGTSFGSGTHHWQWECLKHFIPNTMCNPNVSKITNQKKHKPQVKKPKKVGSKERLASPKPRCSKHMIGNLKLLINFTWKFLGTVRFKKDDIAAILGYGDLQWGNILITRVYFIEGLGHNLFLVRQFCDSDLEVTFKRNTCFVRNLEGVDLLKQNHTKNLYTINLHEMASASSICLMACATSMKSWLLHQQLSHLNFDIINDLAKNDLVIGLLKFKYHKEHLCPSYIAKLGAKGDIGFFIGYSGNSYAYRVYNRRTKKIMEMMNLTFDEILAMAFEQRSSKPRLQSMTSGQINLGLDLTYAPSIITTQKPTEREIDLLFEVMYDDYIGGQPSAATRTALATQAP